ncbi:hypothetical protein [Candidatus Vidania fulgoroideorum]
MFRLIKNVKTSLKKTCKILKYYRKIKSLKKIMLIVKNSNRKIDKILYKEFYHLKKNLNIISICANKSIYTKKVKFRAKGGSDRIIKRRINILIRLENG